MLRTLNNYLFDIHTIPDSSFVIVGLSVSGVWLFIGFLAPLIKRTKPFQHWPFGKLLLTAWASVLRTAGLLWLVLFFLRFQAISPFTMRIWVYSLIPPVIIWLIINYRATQQSLPDTARQNMLHEHYEKYLPQERKRGRA